MLEQTSETHGTISSMVQLKDGTLIYLLSDDDTIKLTAYCLTRKTKLNELSFPRHEEDLNYLERLQLTEDGNQIELYFPKLGISKYGCLFRDYDSSQNGYMVMTFSFDSSFHQTAVPKKVLSNDLIKSEDVPGLTDARIEFHKKINQLKKDFKLPDLLGDCKNMIETANSYILSFMGCHEIYLLNKNDFGFTVVDPEYQACCPQIAVVI